MFHSTPIEPSVIAWRAGRKEEKSYTSDRLPVLQGAGNAADLYDFFGDINRASRLFRNDPRFHNLAKDPAHRGKIRPGGVREALTILYAEKIGLVKGPIARYPAPEFDFLDGTGTVIDVKTPVSPMRGEKWRFCLQEVVNSVCRELSWPKRPNSTPKKILMDVRLRTH